jgi:CubicO group peptidase (beta-lactamase class C family)
MVEVMEAYLDRLASSDYFSGVVVLARDGVPLLEKAYGYSSRSHRSKNRTDTKFNIGSITKVFTALSVLQLVEKRAITLDDPAWCHVPDYPGGLDKAITIRHLLTHTSGMGRGAFDAPLFPVHARSIADWLPLTVAEPAFAPGEGVDYSNGAFVVLGAIIEQVTGMSYDDYVAENIYRRAGMTSSGAFELDDLRENLAIGYTHARSFGTGQVIQFEPGPRRNSLFLNGIKGNPAGLTYTTAADLLAFEKALRQHRLLGPDLTRLFLEPQVEVPGEPESGVTRQFGFGWEFESGTGPEFIGKDGGSWGVSARFAMFPRSAHTLVVLSNYDSIAPIVAGYLGELIAGLEASPGEDK